MSIRLEAQRPHEIIRSANDLTATALTSALKADGVLPSGRVTNVQQCESKRTQFARMWRLSLFYSDDAPKAAPRQLFVKLSIPEQRCNGREVTYYREVARRMLRPSSARCYSAEYCHDSGSYHLILDDLTDSHYSADDGMPPVQREAESMIDTLATLHSFWWDHPSLLCIVSESERADSLRLLRKAADAIPAFCDFLGDRLTSEIREIYDWVSETYVDLVDRRILTGNSLTLIHGDAHAWNFLLPRNPRTHQTCLIDWYSHRDINRAFVGPADLAALIVPWWSKENRRDRELPLLRRYLGQLHEYGVRDYNWDELWYDYRLAAVKFMLDPVIEHGRSSPSRWYPWLERTAALLIEHGYRDL